MDLSTYQQLSGVTVPDGKASLISAQLDRCQAMLETLLGYPLSSDEATQNLYNELGKSKRECACPSVDTENLDEPDDVIGAYRLYDYNTLDQYFHVDPFKVIHKVKLVHTVLGEDDNGVTIKTFKSSEVRPHIGRGGFSKYLEHCKDCFCTCECIDNCLQLAVDADWLWDDSADIPKELQYVLTDMVTWYSNPKRDIKSESITTHSYTKYDRLPPETEPDNLAVIRKYAGPLGSATVNPTHGAQPNRGRPIWVSP